MKKIIIILVTQILGTAFLSHSETSYAEIEIKLDTTVIKGNTELPKILYIVPWKEIKHSKYDDEQQLVIHSLYGDLFDPVIPVLSDTIH